MGWMILVASLFAGPTQSGSLAFSKPEAWKDRAPASSMRVAEFVVPRAAGDSEDGELIVYYFGGGGGSVEENLKRWEGQFASAKDVSRGSIEDKAKGVKISTIDVKGTYIAELRPGSAERHNKPGFRMRAAVVETSKGPYFVKLTGPAATIEAAGGAYEQFLKSLAVK
jgi:hypothetical protein